MWFGIGKPDEKKEDGLKFVIMIAIAKMPENTFRKDMFKAKRKPIEDMCEDIEKIYGDALEKIVLYGSYARGEQTDESDVDIALIQNDKANEKMHDEMTDIVVDYELEQGITLSIVPIEYVQYQQWNRVLPFYKKIDKEGIVLWKAV